MTDGTMSLRGLARLIGVDDKAIRKALLAGVFSDAAVRRDARGAPEVINATVAIAEWERSGRQLRGSVRPQNAVVTPPAPLSKGDGQPPTEDAQAEITALLARVRSIRAGLVPSDAPAVGAASDASPREDLETSPTLVKAQTEAMIERGRKLRMENNLREGTLIEADQAARQAFEFSRTVRENVLNVPARIAAELAAENDASRVHVRLEKALREALSATAAMLEHSAPTSATAEE